MQSPPGPSREKIWRMFDQISATYDTVNRVITLGCDQCWRKKMNAFLPKRSPLTVLDCATGTGDQIIALMERNPNINNLIGIDLAEEMLKLAEKKLSKKVYFPKIELKVADVMNIPLQDNSVDCVTISFGIRNVAHTMLALQEFRRVLKPGGRVLILEGTTPTSQPLASLHRFYLRYILPSMGGMLSQNKAAYRYLNETIETFPQGELFNGKLRAAGFVNVKDHPLLGGIVTIYQGDKDDPLHD